MWRLMIDFLAPVFIIHYFPCNTTIYWVMRVFLLPAVLLMVCYVTNMYYYIYLGYITHHQYKHLVYI